ncbi:MAG: hypothetical protein COY66_03015 [Candidatus Kerfeldbacteria bacterium CG_4_10_14_0_8_um_filter_42_10]|uniref:Uncharacterized protein n=1 Tax=Candidatus Kerfeldbacteria bacterium CG_4_10_14_0_8_um_filter_42_10 TaxID=2014248 RepID=A0A2M7RJ50_9BACT|nr:MAG: hypothetical protein COY66_03015 [Candidatus Kerfeldbacteria bacterium CG_4_10_14_0_8_um_filter_42_10]
MPEQQFEQQPKPEIIPERPIIPETDEKKVELEKDLAELEKQIAKEEQKAASAQPVPAATTPTPIAVPKSETRREIEKILSEDLVDIYQSMDANQKLLFRQKGEETATLIENLIQTAKATAKKVIQLIGDWLKLIPGVNKFFLEQETKIKTDRILEIIKKKKGE